MAHLRLVPAAGDRPESGQSGDLFVDSARELWFCSHETSWVKLT